MVGAVQFDFLKKPKSTHMHLLIYFEKKNTEETNNYWSIKEITGWLKDRG